MVADAFTSDDIGNREVLVPVRDFFEKSGYEVKWNAKTKDVYIIDEKENVIFVFGKETSKNNIILLGNKAYFNLKDLKKSKFISNMDLNREIQIAYKDERDLNLKKGSRVPNFIYVKDNEIHDLYDILDKNNKTIIIFWASWCPNCDEVINYLENHNIKDMSNIKIITISIDSIPQKSNHFIAMNDPKKETFKAFIRKN
ncbi:MAG: stalk domain-containing protein [Peptoniphilus lacydonensis]|uniref:redoxin family protein n=1 Tax=Peptoniphilus lacydonensis TaxID=1673725 RepID=UPI0029038907|nr:stalk domain-containing protein [Peptoniphilus lacydonensis]MDU1954150.1 stalk domain-containing protein [Peptoniphilus lacydonensis]MDU5274674.1 stalk domain-containing protein [Peptoniphilus lacydonensis]